MAGATAGTRAAGGGWRSRAAPFARELAGVAATGLLYFLARGAVSDRAGEAFERARDLLRLEEALGLAWERAIHDAALASGWIVELANAVYFWGHMPALIALALWLWARERGAYRRFRNALLISAAIGIACYALLPTAPPRFFPELGFVDTLAERAAPAYQAQELGPFVNPYAALPSLHAGWALLAGWACLLAARRRSGAPRTALIVLALLIPASQIWAVVATANHWTLDAAAGAAVIGIAIALEPRFAAVCGRLGNLRAREGPAPSGASGNRGNRC